MLALVISAILIVLGAILRFGVTGDLMGIAYSGIGVILIVMGIIGLVFALMAGPDPGR